MTDFSQVLFVGGKATPLMLGRWRSKGALKPLPADLQLTSQGEATDAFRSLWVQAFPDRPPLPRGILHLKDGTITVAFHGAWR